MDTTSTLIGVLGAAIPGILVALLAHQLDVRRQERLMRIQNANGRTMIALEIDGNRQALASFWQTLNALDKESAQHPEREAHLAAMAAGGILGQTVPHWSFARWEGILPGTVATLDRSEIVAIDQMNRDLRTIADLFTQLVTMTPSEMAQLEKDRFWMNRYAGFRVGTFERMEAVVARVLKSSHPLAA